MTLRVGYLNAHIGAARYWRCEQYVQELARSDIEARISASASDLVSWADVVVVYEWTANGQWPTVRDWRGPVVYDLDDNPWAAFASRYVELPRPDLATEIAGRADLITVATPYLSGIVRRRPVRLIRNALDLRLYDDDTPRYPRERPRLAFYGALSLQPLIGLPDDRGRWTGGEGGQAFAAHANEVHGVFLGAPAGSEAMVAQAFDEQWPWIDSAQAFAKVLALAQPDIGIAPLIADDFCQGKSELHWLEYSAVGAAFVGERMGKDGPYSVVRDGVDGLLAHSVREWDRALQRLIESRDLRQELAGAARERVAKEYDQRDRAQEWADALTSAAMR